SNFENDFPNQLNVRGQRIEYSTDDFVILLIGDSQVEAATNAPSLMPEKILQNYLNAGLKKSNVKVFSLAASGWGQDQQLLALEKYYKNYRANLILVWTTPKNDFWENAFPDRSLTKVAGHLKPTFYLKNQKLEGPFFKPNNYYQNSVLIQILFSAIQNLEDKTLEQKILDEWLNKLPVPHNFNSDIKEIYWSENKEIDLDEFSENLFKYKNED
ncbi:MAG: hypothetical protein KC587_19370, partial [Nitrospira sp.]|nr:hypothetical protein [Nitrospira sp.]